VFNEMLGFDPKDSTSLDAPREDFTRHLNDPLQGVRIGVPREFFGEGLKRTSSAPCALPWPITRSSARG